MLFGSSQGLNNKSHSSWSIKKLIILTNSKLLESVKDGNKISYVWNKKLKF